MFGCACYPNLSSTAPHKLSPRSSLCIFLGYYADHKGYRCLDLHSNKIIVSRHVVFDESFFPFSDMSTSLLDPTTLDIFSDDDCSTLLIGASAVHVGTPSPDGAQAALAPVADSAWLHAPGANEPPPQAGSRSPPVGPSSPPKPCSTGPMDTTS
jgi:hypothetical protein